MTTITLRVSDEDKSFLDFMAKFHGVSLSELIKNRTLESLEDEFDRQSLEKIKAENLLDPEYRLISADEVKTELGL